MHCNSAIGHELISMTSFSNDPFSASAPVARTSAGGFPWLMEPPIYTLIQEVSESLIMLFFLGSCNFMLTFTVGRGGAERHPEGQPRFRKGWLHQSKRDTAGDRCEDVAS